MTKAGPFAWTDIADGGYTATGAMKERSFLTRIDVPHNFFRLLASTTGIGSACRKAESRAPPTLFECAEE
jgi:hypothetical protein